MRAEHSVRILSRPAGDRPGGLKHHAVCKCGERGPWQATPAVAARDGALHLADTTRSVARYQKASA